MADNWGFVAAAYGLTAVVLLIYCRRLRRKEQALEVLKRLNAERNREPSSSGHPRPDLDSRSALQQDSRSPLP
jgi:hypothetical protein